MTARVTRIRPAAAGANGDVDAEDAGEERSSTAAEKGQHRGAEQLQQGGDGGELELAARDEEG